MPPAKIGIVGGGQLGKMLCLEAKKMGYQVVVLDPTVASPASQVADRQIVASFSDKESIRQLAKDTDVVTYEFEHIDSEILIDLEAEGYTVYPSGKTLQIIQNKYTQKSFLLQGGLPIPRFSPVSSVQDIEANIKKYGLPLVLKTCTGGYDGKGNAVIRSLEDIENCYSDLGQGKVPLMIEEFIDFQKEVSIVVARNLNGQIVHYPVVENIHHNSILHLTKAPGQVCKEVEDKIKDISIAVMELFEDIGVFCIEMFVTKDKEVYINEIAPRPHNSGHYTIEGCITSQYEQQLRAITGMPLGSPRQILPAVMVNILGNSEVRGNYGFEGIDHVLDGEGVYLHLYCKHKTQNLKKIGHITVINEDIDKAESLALKALDKIKIVSL